MHRNHVCWVLPHVSRSSFAKEKRLLLINMLRDMIFVTKDTRANFGSIRHLRKKYRVNGIFLNLFDKIDYQASSYKFKSRIGKARLERVLIRFKRYL